jgi:hypothetical protein
LNVRDLAGFTARSSEDQPGDYPLLLLELPPDEELLLELLLDEPPDELLLEELLELPLELLFSSSSSVPSSSESMSQELKIGFASSYRSGTPSPSESVRLAAPATVAKPAGEILSRLRARSVSL